MNQTPPPFAVTREGELVAASDDTRPFIVAEIGHNHGGSLEKAKQLVRAAHAAGADAVKLQKRDNRTLFTKAMFNEPYTGRNSFGPTYGAHREALEFDAREFRELQSFARDLGIVLFSTAFDLPSVDFLVGLGVPAIKISSSDLIHTPLLRYAASAGKPMIVSTGGADDGEVRQAYETIREVDADLPLALLQCSAIYPAQPDDLNLGVIASYRKQFPDAVIGFSGHDFGTKLSAAAQRLGARVIEKHFTLDRSDRGSDHHFSLLPDEMADLVDAMRASPTRVESPEEVALDSDPEIKASVGSTVKTFDPRERSALRKLAKSLVAVRDLPAGHRVEIGDVAYRSPGGGPMKPYQVDEIVGLTLRDGLPENGQFSSGLFVESAADPIRASAMG